LFILFCCPNLFCYLKGGICQIGIWTFLRITIEFSIPITYDTVCRWLQDSEASSYILGTQSKRSISKHEMYWDVSQILCKKVHKNILFHFFTFNYLIKSIKNYYS